MSLFGKIFKGIGKVVKGVTKVAKPLAGIASVAMPGVGGIGMAVRAATGIAGAVGAATLSKHTTPTMRKPSILNYPTMIGNSILPALPSIGGTIARTAVKSVPSLIGGAAIGAGAAAVTAFTDAKGKGYAIDDRGRCRRLNACGEMVPVPRRINPLNGKAARRAIRRIKGARKMLQSIERQLPKQRSHACKSRKR